MKCGSEVWLGSASAVAAHQKRLGASEAQQGKLLASPAELTPWLRQWHHEIDPTFGERMDEFFAGIVETEARRLHLSRKRSNN